MYKILDRVFLSDDIVLQKIQAPMIAKSALPGQFLIIVAKEDSERIPLTICDSNVDEGSVTIVTQLVGSSTREIASMDKGEAFFAVAGPLGRPSVYVNENLDELRDEKYILIAGGVGTAPLLAQAKWLNDKGVSFDTIIGARNKDLLILEDEFREVSDNLYLATDDGSYGFHGTANLLLKDLVLNQGKSYSRAIIIGPMIMMKFTVLTTKELNIPSVVSMNPIMVDGTGMCGACRVKIGDEVKFACTDGPEFDGELVDFDEAMRRSLQYKEEEMCRIVRDANV